MGVEISIVLAGVKGAIFLWDKEERGGLGRFGRDYTSSFQVLFDEHLTGFHFLRVQGVDFGDLRGESWPEVNDMVVGSMRWEFFMGFL